MFTTKTLFVLGAGSSKEAKMPEGNELLVNIAQLLNFSYDSRFDRELGSAKIQDAIAIHMQELSNGAQTNANPYLQAAKDIHHMAPMSDTIDGVLDRHQDNEYINLCGKLAISEAILIAEKNSYLSSMDHDLLKDTWSYKFFKILMSGIPKKALSSLFDNLAIINFNYDRCLKHFLVNAVVNNYLITLREAQALVAKIRIIHPYGSVGSLDFESPEGLSFGADVNAAKLLSIASKIQTFTERTSDANLMQEIENLIRESKRIVFLGFAYHSQNLKLIAVDELDKKDMLGTAFNIPKPNLEFIRYNLTQALKIKPRPPHEHGIILEHKRCKDLLNNHSHRLSS